MQLEKKVLNNLAISIEPELRLDNSFKPSSYLLQAGLGYKIAPWMKLGAFYRFDAEQNENSSFSYMNRFAFDMSFMHKISRFTPKARVRFSNFTDFDSSTDDKSNYMRYKFGTSYNIKGSKLNPFLSVELYQKMENGLINKARYSFGTEYTLNKRNSIELKYSYDYRFKNLNNTHILELKYSLNFK
ncbi:DUF2490 domain-containing protein [Tenuifilum thalassicum]|nr:DUF2490 domain-containing protein [Tenuifilum thalassicum]